MGKNEITFESLVSAIFSMLLLVGILFTGVCLMFFIVKKPQTTAHNKMILDSIMMIFFL
jgi:hypothetical protein